MPPQSSVDEKVGAHETALEYQKEAIDDLKDDVKTIKYYGLPLLLMNLGVGVSEKLPVLSSMAAHYVSKSYYALIHFFQ